MSERRRSLLILLAVVALMAGAAVAVAAKPTKLGLDLQGGVQLIYQAKPTPQQPTVTADAMQRSLQTWLRAKGYFAVEVKSVWDKSKAVSGKVNVHFEIKRGAQFRIGKIAGSRYLAFDHELRHHSLQNTYSYKEID